MLLERRVASWFSTTRENLGRQSLELGLTKGYVELLNAKGGIF